MTIRNLPRAIATCLLLVGLPGLLEGQQARDSTETPDDSTVVPLEEVRVEVSRLRVGGIPLARLPLSAQVLGGVQLSVGRVTAAEALARLPGVTLADQFGSPFQQDIRLRGFAVSPVVGLPQSVSVFVDGVRVNEADASQVHFNLIPTEDVERVEVIRGPMGAFGKNTLGGALNFVTRRGAGAPTAQVSVSGGYYEELEGRGRAQGQLGDFDYYLSGGYYRSEGWRRRNYAEQRQLFTKLGWRGATTDLSVSYTFAEDSIEAPGSLPRSWLRDELPGDVVDPPDDPRELQFTGGEGDNFGPQLHFVIANLRQELGGAWGLQANAFGRFADFRQFNDGLTEPDALGLTDIASGGATVQLSYQPNSAASASLGVEYSRNDVDIEIRELPNESFPDIDPGGELTERVGTEEDNFGVFSELWYGIGPRLSIYGSARFDHVRLPFNDLLDPSQSGDNDFQQLTGSLGADYTVSSTLNVFASYGRGFRAPVILELSCADPEDPCPLPFELGADPPLDPVKTDTWQAGLRYNAGPLVQADISAYWSEVYDDLFNVVDPERPTRGFFANIDRTRRQGVEAAVSARPARDVTLDGTFAWTRATFQSRTTLAVAFGGEEEGENGDPGGDPGGEEEEAPGALAVQPGDHFAMVPEFTFSLGGRYSPGEWTLGLDGRFVGSQFFVGDESNTEAFGKLDSYFLVDVYVEREIGPVTVTARALNLLDNEYNSFGIVSENPRAAGAVEEAVEPFFTPGQPFRIFAGLSYSFR